jgi:glucan phosphoethanolaminetransferase (alkaline phosphatase superfamily)
MGSSCFVFVNVHKRNPSILKPALLQDQRTEIETTYNWNMILNILVVCGALAAAILATCNVVIFLFTNQWLLDVRMVVGIAIIFMIFSLKQFDVFVRRLLKKALPN